MSRFIDWGAEEASSNEGSESGSDHDDIDGVDDEVVEEEVYVDRHGKKHYINMGANKTAKKTHASRAKDESGGYPDESDGEDAHSHGGGGGGGGDDFDSYMEHLTKPEKRLIKGFCSRLLLSAATGGAGTAEAWEEHEVARLVALMQRELQLRERKLVKLLLKSELTSPTTLACLRDEGVTISAASTLHLIVREGQAGAAGGGGDRLASRVDEALEQGLISTKNLPAMQALYDMVVPRQSNRALSQLVRVLCEHCKSKAHFGEVMGIFTAHLTDDEAAAFMQPVLGSEAFRDLEGSIHAFLAPMSHSHAALRSRIQEMYNISEEGHIVDSDEDDKGNLRDFVVSDEEDEDNGSDEEGSYEDDDNDDNEDEDNEQDEEEEEELLSEDDSDSSGSGNSGSNSGSEVESGIDDYKKKRKGAAASSKTSKSSKKSSTSSRGARASNSSSSKRRLGGGRRESSEEEEEEEEDDVAPRKKSRNASTSSAARPPASSTKITKTTAASKPTTTATTAATTTDAKSPSPQIIRRGVRGGGGGGKVMTSRRVVCSDSEEDS